MAVKFKYSLIASLSVIMCHKSIASSGTIKLLIKDEAGKAIENARVYISSSESLHDKLAKTNKKGEVFLSGLFPSKKYSVHVSKDGYADKSLEPIHVVSGKSFLHTFTLIEEDSIEVISVTHSQQINAIDTQSALISTDINLDITESLPTGRSYQSYLQLVPGTSPSSIGNPASKSGINYADIGGVIGNSTDNTYILDGINVTDNQNGTFGANINSEIIQELRVLTGGLPAEYEGGAGLVSQVVTKSGSNEFSGSVNYYFQNDKLVSHYQHQEQNNFSNYDAAITLGGPIIKDKMWFFSSYQEKVNQRDMTSLDSQTFMRAIKQESKLFFAKLTFEPSNDDLIELSYFRDPTKESGTNNPTTPNNRDYSSQTGGNNIKLEYRKYFDDINLSFKYAKHEGENSRLAKSRQAFNNIAYRGNTVINTQKGGLGYDSYQHINREDVKFDIEYYLDANDWGEHTIKFSAGLAHNDNIINEVYTDTARYKSISQTHQAVTLNEYATSGVWRGDINLSKDDYDPIIRAIEQDSHYHALLPQLDTNNDGQISHQELGQGIIFDSSATNPHGDINVYRNAQTSQAPIALEQIGHTLYLQDTAVFGPITIQGGLRAERWTHKNSKGDKIITFGWDIAPRLSSVYKIDNQSKIWAFVGRYYDPIRTNMTYFSGNVSGPQLEDQIYLNDKWLTYRIRGGEKSPQAMFSPHTKTPYTDEFMLGYTTGLGDDMSLELTYTKRETHDLVEDYTYSLYTQTLKGTDFYLPESYFGMEGQKVGNYVLANLKGGIRKYRGYEVKFTKHSLDNFLFSASYTYNDAIGNTNSDSSVNFQGDFVWHDPRAPNHYGRLPGSIKHLVKMYANYEFDNGVELGAVYNWNSGTYYNQDWQFANRYLPRLGEQNYEYGGIEGKWLASTAIGQTKTPSYGTLDLRLKYTHDFGHFDAEFFIDIFNLFNNQAITRAQSLYLGDRGKAFGDGINWVEPRRLYLGTRISF